MTYAAESIGNNNNNDSYEITYLFVVNQFPLHNADTSTDAHISEEKRIGSPRIGEWFYLV